MCHQFNLSQDLLCVLSVIGILFGKDLDRRSSGDFQNLPSRPATFSKSNGVDLATMSDGYLHALALFVQKGAYTKSMYQAQVNHRKVNFLALKYGTGVKNRSMIESFIDPHKDDTFDNSDAISFCLHGVEEHNTDGVGLADRHLMLMTPNTMRRVISVAAPDSGQEEKRNAIGFGYAKNLKVCDMSGDNWRRLLTFWGFTWVDQEGNHITDNRRPTDADICTFLSMLKTIDLSSKESFESMINEFCLEDLYTYDNSVLLEVNVNRFGALMRALVPIRVSIFEGQHRFFLIHNYLHGFYEVTSSVPLKRIPFYEAHNMTEDSNWVEVSCNTDDRQTFK